MAKAKELPIKVGDRIVYFGEKPLRGSVRWLGIIEDICDGTTAGIELDKPRGSNNGVWAGRRYFDCAPKHGVFINLAGLITEDNFECAENSGEELEEVVDEKVMLERMSGFGVNEDPSFLRLQQAIYDGSVDEAAEIARNLAGKYSKSKKKKNSPAKAKDEVRAKKGQEIAQLDLSVKVEMKDGNEDAFKISIPYDYTLKMLKEKVEKDFHYEIYRQRWIFNKKLIMDDKQFLLDLNSAQVVLYLKDAEPNDGANGRETNSSAQWKCSQCTFLNEPTRPGCFMCGLSRPTDYVVQKNLQEEYENTCKKAEMAFLEKYDREKRDNFLKYVELDNLKVVHTNKVFECKICFMDVSPGDGIQLRECLHSFCIDCIKASITNCENIPVKCPYSDENYMCQSVIQDREIQQILSEEELLRYNNLCWAKAASSVKNSFYCKAPDCKGWCVFEYGAQQFECPICKQISCITCQVIHQGKNCKEYQDDLKRDSQNNEDARQTQAKIQEMIKEGTAMDCPGCGIVIMKTIGCDGMTCSHCQIAICWATKGPRWGPKGQGDTSGGCHCREPPRNQMCHPNCQYCH